MTKKPQQMIINRDSKVGKLFIELHWNTLHNVFHLIGLSGINPNDFFLEFLKAKQKDIAEAQRLKISKVPMQKEPEKIQ